MATRSELAAWSDEFRLFALVCERDGAPTYRRICEGIAQEPELLSLVAAASSEQRRPNLLLAAVHSLLLSGLDHPLVRWYPTVARYRTDAPPHHEGAVPMSAGGAVPMSAGGAVPLSAGDPFAAFADLCRAHRPELEALVRTHSTQTNEIGRCNALLPAFATISASTARPLSLVDLGASAGLNLLFDRYAYDYVDGATGYHTAGGDPSSPVHLRAEVRHGALPRLATPPAPWRMGLDHDPVDPTELDKARWLLACQWPDHLDRFTRLQAALELVRRLPDRPTVVGADMVDDLARIAVQAPQDTALCLFHTWSAAYLSVERQLDLVGAVQEVAAARPLWWLFAENAYEVPSLPVPPPPPAHAAVRGASVLVLVELDQGAMRVRRLADVHPHGRWLHWW